MVLPNRHAERARRLTAVDLTHAADPLLERVVLAHCAWVGVETGTPEADGWGALALRSLEGDLLLKEAHRRAAYAMCARGLVMTGHPAAGRAIAALREGAMTRGSLRLRVAAAFYASEHALRCGRVSEAENHARLALDLVDEPLNTFTGGAAEV